MSNKGKSIKQKRRKCMECYRIFANNGAKMRHWWATHYVDPPPPPKPEVPVFHSYASLVTRDDGSIVTWGRDMTKAQRKSPDREELKLGLLTVIAQSLHRIEVQLKKPKTLS